MNHSLRRVVYFGLLWALLAVLSLRTDVDWDVFHELALIREAVALDRLPTRDVFAYTPTVTPVVPHKWGTGAVLYLVTVSSGLGAAGLLPLRSSLCLFIGVREALAAKYPRVDCRGERIVKAFP